MSTIEPAKKNILQYLIIGLLPLMLPVISKYLQKIQYTGFELLLCRTISPVILDEKLTNFGKKHTELNFSG